VQERVGQPVRGRSPQQLEQLEELHIDVSTPCPLVVRCASMLCCEP
jgi:hypothetical protein